VTKSPSALKGIEADKVAGIRKKNYFFKLPGIICSSYKGLSAKRRGAGALES